MRKGAQDEAHLREAIRSQAHQHKRYGYRRVTVVLKRAGRVGQASALEGR
jgi:hypothetical protein